jgi:thioesterase domain-containing protein/acyl carrier protein
VELEEIRALLATRTEAAHVVLRRFDSGEPRLLAYAVAGEASSDGPGLRRFLASHLPAYMVPAAVLLLPAMPLTPNGKVDEARLPAPENLASEVYPVAPRDQVERRLVDIWRTLLGREPGIYDHFFELGGHSLLAVRILDRVKREFGWELPLSVFFEQGTVAHMADVLRAGPRHGRAPLLVALKPEGERPPIFCFYPAGGSAFAVAELAAALPPEQPFYALRCPGMEEGEQLLTTVVQQAEAHLAEIRRVQPEGPYHLAGYCMGGVVAGEMALLLEDVGQTVAFLGMIDIWAPDSGYRPPGYYDDDAVLIRLAGAMDIHLTREELADLDESGRLSLLLERAVAAGALPDDVSPARARRLIAVYRNNIAAMHAWRPRRRLRVLHLYRAADEAYGPHLLPDLGWADYVEDMNISTVPGDHDSVVRAPAVVDLARALVQALTHPAKMESR